jgi:hypothetical protein
LILRIAVMFWVCTNLQAQSAGYGGPGILSRGLKGAGQRSGQPVSIRPFASVLSTYDTGIIGVGLDQNGNISNPGATFGVEANIGAYGTKSWKAQQLGMSYLGNYRNYFQNSYFNGSDHMLALDYTRQVGRRNSFMLRSSAGTSSRSLGGLSGIGFGGIDQSYLGVPVYDIFDNRSYFADVTGMLTTQIGLRNSLSLGGSGFAVRRQSAALVGMNGQRAFADYSRRYGRYTSFGFSYQFFHVDYPRVFGEGDTHSAMITFGRTIGRAWTIGIGVGLYRVDFSGVRRVTLDPVIAELLGTTTGREAFNTINLAPSFQANITRAFRRSSFNLNYNRSANPGNGVILLSRAENVFASYSYNASRRWSFSGMGGYSNISGYGAFSGAFRAASVGAQANYRFWSDLHFSSGVDVRRNYVSQSDFTRIGTRVYLGVTFSPGEFPVSFR